ncbi:centrosomal protein 68 [Homo sapiens]|uniref:Isoform 2 of Centrosomal protein of 68 kDa n=1 Tax=Homo sapiens TaxID=9606 RepID=Q76N32-2|nr:centrosomal protein of 68 kDa isoform b [Homo sapiens]EAW99927.1 centrosomal protein 68kDa, isoform CRA_b [Homo sapiens]EAW99928.1 centrosomal protein 68kDa, isoform CRA_b [Homo sapiens]KAI2523641.1 centrosomal protein 68 [Homo sapiens]KAI4034790.1 centrosomal protein 68 [Homo sapiens]|eukprot:NP_001306030.1 centrosomal protein of 68 kDa isoform b [Homo sapiens]
MALGEEKAEAEASEDTKAQSYGRGSCRERELDIPGPMSGEQPPRLEAEGGLISPVWGAEGIPAPTCWIGTDPGGPSRAHQPQASDANREPVAERSEPALSGLPPATMGSGDLLLSGESQVEKTKLSSSEEFPQTLSLPRTTTICSGHDADTEDDPSLADLPQALDLSQQPHSSGLSCLSQWKSVLSPGSAAQPSSCSISASSTGSSLQGHQERAEPRGGSLAKVSSSLEPVVPQEPSSVVGLGPRPQWSPQPVFSGGDASGLGRRRLSFQAEYWACVLPDSLPPSPDRHSPLWNPNKEYEDLLDYTYPLRPGPQLPKHLDSRVPADPVLQDSGVDLDSFSVSPASTLKSPTNVSPNCPPAEATALPFSGPREPSLKQWPSRVPQKQGGMGLASWSQLASTPRAPGSRDARWERREPALRGAKDRLTIGKHLDMGSPQLRTRDRGWPSPRPEREKRTSQSARRPTCTESRWKSEEEVESDDEYLALPARLTQTFCCQLEELICWLYNVADVTDHGTAARSNLTSLKSSLQLYRQFKKDIDEHQSLTESVLQKGEILLQCLLENTPVLEDVLGRIAKQSGELESHADRLYDSILASLDMLAGCTLIPDKKPMAAMEHPCEGV